MNYDYGTLTRRLEKVENELIFLLRREAERLRLEKADVQFWEDAATDHTGLDR